MELAVFFVLFCFFLIVKHWHVSVWNLGIESYVFQKTNSPISYLGSIYQDTKFKAKWGEEANHSVWRLPLNLPVLSPCFSALHSAHCPRAKACQVHLGQRLSSGSPTTQGGWKLEGGQVDGSPYCSMKGKRPKGSNFILSVFKTFPLFSALITSLPFRKKPLTFKFLASHVSCEIK